MTTTESSFLPADGWDLAAWRAAFAWPSPDRLNIAEQACTRWASAEPEREALRIIDRAGHGTVWTYAALEEASNRIADGLLKRGVARGDRVAILLPQGAPVPIAHLATYKIGAIAVPLANLFGPDAIAYRLRHAGAKALVTNEDGVAKLLATLADGEAYPDLTTLVTTGNASVAGPFNAVGWDGLLAEGRPDPVMAKTGPNDPALMIYTSGTTGSPKGALHAHRIVTGHLPGVTWSHGGMPRAGDRFWTPSDWAWAGGLLNVLLSGLTLGVPIVGGDIGRFDPEAALELMRREAIRNVFLPPTALKMLKEAPSEAFEGLALRSVASGGESLGTATRDWARTHLCPVVNELYGQTEANYLVASNAEAGTLREGAIGAAVAGHDLAILDDDGQALPAGETGEVCLRAPDPVMMLRYWEDEAATRRAFHYAGDEEAADWSDVGRLDGAWLRTGDRGWLDADGYLTFGGRGDDVITSAGYRIGPSEIEDCLARHPAVALVAAIGVPDALRTEIIRAVVVPAEGFTPTPDLAEELRLFARERLSSHQYPREVVFRADMPLTTTGKVVRRQLRAEAAEETRA
ncbi:MAG: AMP-binding protein [Pseudomonadota bacterium]